MGIHTEGFPSCCGVTNLSNFYWDQEYGEYYLSYDESIDDENDEHEEYGEKEGNVLVAQYFRDLMQKKPSQQYLITLAEDQKRIRKYLKTIGFTFSKYKNNTSGSSVSIGHAQGCEVLLQLDALRPDSKGVF